MKPPYIIPGRTPDPVPRPDRAIAAMEESLHLGESSGFLVPQVLARADLASVYGQLGLTERGLEVKRYAKPTNTRPAPTPLAQQIASEVDVVVEALSD